MAASEPRIWIPATLLFSGFAIVLLAAPPVIRGLAAREWLTHYRAIESLPRPSKALSRLVVAKADAAIQNLAPLPQASTAALLALEIGQRVQVEDHDRAGARLIYEGVRESCAQARKRPLAGPGFAVIEARALALQASLGDEPAP